MTLFWWTVNTSEDSGPTNYLVMAETLLEARYAVLASEKVPTHHRIYIERADPAMPTAGQAVILP